MEVCLSGGCGRLFLCLLTGENGGKNGREMRWRKWREMLKKVLKIDWVALLGGEWVAFAENEKYLIGWRMGGVN